MYKSLNDTVPTIPSFLTALSHSELLNQLTNGFTSLDPTATAVTPLCHHNSLCTTPPFPLPMPNIQLPFCGNPTSTSLFTSSSSSSSATCHHYRCTEVAAPAATRPAKGLKEEQESVASSMPLTASTPRLPGKRKFKEGPEMSEGQIIAGGDPKRYRTTYSPYQSRVLEEVFQTEHYISRPQRAQLATQLQLPENTIKVRGDVHFILLSSFKRKNSLI